MSELAKILTNEFQDKEYAEAYMQEHVVQRIAAQLYHNRKERGLSQKELSRLSKIAQERISKIENADFESITLSTLFKFCRALDVSLNVELSKYSDTIVRVINTTPQNLFVSSRPADLSEIVSRKVVKVDDSWSIANQSYSEANGIVGVTNNEVVSVSTQTYDFNEFFESDRIAI